MINRWPYCRVPAYLTLTTVLGFACMFASGIASAQSFKGVLTWHNDTLRTGQNTLETVLTPSNVNSAQFGKLFSYPVNGEIYGQPLYVANLYLPRHGKINVVYVVTEEDQVYAFDADKQVPAIWHDDFTNPSGGITAVPSTGPSICPAIGITSTPVIDLANKTLYVLARTLENGSYVHRLHALNLSTGAEEFGGPVVIQASVPGTGKGNINGVINFNPKSQSQRAGLLLWDNNVYLGFAGAVHGWILEYSAQTLAQVAAMCITPNGETGSIWQSGGGLAVDGNGYIYAITADGTFDANTGNTDYGDTMMKLNSLGGLSVIDYFTPDNQNILLQDDLDFGSGGVVLLPKQPGLYPYEAIGAGKDGNIYLVNRNNMGKYNTNSNNVIQQLLGNSTGYWATPAYWNSTIYYGGRNDNLRMYPLTDGLLSTSSTSQSATVFQFPGTTPSVSSNGLAGGIVWAIERDDNNKEACSDSLPAILHAYDATNLANELYNTTQAGSRDQLGVSIKFTLPTVANGKVYVGTGTELDVLGLLP